MSAPLVLFVIFKALMGKAMRDAVCPYTSLSAYLKVRPHAHCPPLHIMAFNSRNEGSQCVG